MLLPQTDRPTFEVYPSIHRPLPTAVQTEDSLYSSFAKFQNEAITMAIVARCLINRSIIPPVTCLQGDAGNCACGTFYRVMRETVPVGHSTG